MKQTLMRASSQTIQQIIVNYKMLALQYVMHTYGKYLCIKTLESMLLEQQAKEENHLLLICERKREKIKKNEKIEKIGKNKGRYTCMCVCIYCIIFMYCM